MERPEVRFARAADGAYLAYQVLGEGPTVLFWQEDSFALVDELWDSPQELAWHEGLAAFARVIIYDRRGTGLSSRNVAPGSLEVQVQDTLSVLDAEGIERACFGGFLESCAPNVLLAATQPDRVQALVWALPSPRSGVEPGYPWGADATYMEAERVLLERWGTEGWARDYVALNAGVLGGAWSTESYVRFLARVSRRTCTPDVAIELARIWLETDVRDVLPAIQAPMLTIDFGVESQRELAAYIAARAPRTEPTTCPAARWRSSTSGRCTTRSGDSSARSVRRSVWTRCSPRSCSPTSWARPSSRHRSVTSVGRSCSSITIGVPAPSSNGSTACYVDSTGDGLLARFDGPARAVRCARSIAEAVRPLGLEIRAGCHTGEVELDGDQIRGLAVHIGARVAAMAGTGEVLTTSTVKDLTAGSGLTFEDAGEHALKGVPDRWRLYRVVN